MLEFVMAKHVSLTPATQFLKDSKVVFTEHPYDYLEHGGALHSAAELGWDPYAVVKSLLMQDQDGRVLCARGGEPAQWLSGRWYLAIWHPAYHAGVCRVDHSGAPQDPDQWWTTRLSGGH